MKTLTSHLTQTNKKHIKLMLDRNLFEAKVNRINYKITFENGIYTVQIAQVDKSYTNGLQTSKVKFTI